MDSTQAQAASVEELRQIASNLLSSLKPGMVIGLSGQLGVGKTTFIKALAEFLGIQDAVISPTYVYHQSYELPQSIAGIRRLHHLDLYRIHSDSDFAALDLSVDDPQGVVFIEWIEQVPQIAAAADLTVSFSLRDGVRTLTFDWRQR